MLIGVLALLTFIVVGPSYAQSHLALMTGPTVGTMSGGFVEGSDGLELGLSFALDFDLAVSERFALVAGIALVQKGGKKLRLASDAETAYGFRALYVQMPILARAAFAVSGGKWYIAPLAGLTFGINLKCEHKPGDRLLFTSTCGENSPSGAAKRVEIGLPFGVQFWREFRGSSRFILGLHYEMGLANVFSAASDVGQKARNQILVFRAGFALALSGV